MQVRTYGAGDPSRSRPTPEQLREWRRRSHRPVNEIPGTVPIDVVLARTDNVAVALGAMRAYSTGLEFELRVRRTRKAGFGGSEPPSAGLHQQIMGFARGKGGRDAMLLGFGFPDGRTATNIGGFAAPPGQESADNPVLHPGGGGGDNQSYDGTFWLSPLPVGGDLTIVCAWPLHGLDETQVVVAQRLIEDAVDRVVELWPMPADDEEPPVPPPLPNLPAGSWFARAARPDS